jgi:hypothetical protein
MWFSLHVTSSLSHRQIQVESVIAIVITFRTQPHLGCCLAAPTAAASAIFMHLCTNRTTPYTSRQDMRSCNDGRIRSDTTSMPGLCSSYGVSLACTMWCIYGLNYASACACLYDTSMLASMIHLLATIRGLSLLVTNSLCLRAVVIVVTQDSAMEAVIHTCQAFMHKPDHSNNESSPLNQVP